MLLPMVRHDLGSEGSDTDPLLLGSRRPPVERSGQHDVALAPASLPVLRDSRSKCMIW